MTKIWLKHLSKITKVFLNFSKMVETELQVRDKEGLLKMASKEAEGAKEEVQALKEVLDEAQLKMAG